MSDFHLTILGCGSALPANGRNPTAQILRVGKYNILIDCGEGTQHRMRENRVKIQGISHILISHMHGDHYLGLMGLLFSMTLLGRTQKIVIAGPVEIQELIAMHLKHAKAGLGFPIEHVATQARESERILTLPNCSIDTLPLKHKIATTGFLIKELPRLRKLRADKLEKYQVPIKVRKDIAQGHDYIQEDGSLIANRLLTHDPLRPYSYAYCSDTAYKEALVPLLQGVDLLYHESTFLTTDELRAHKTKHSTAAEAGRIAAQAEVGHLLLGHYSARYDDLGPFLEEAQQEFLASRLSEGGMKLDIHSLRE